MNKWICPFCNKKMINSERVKELHLLEDINFFQEQEMIWFAKGCDAIRFFREFFEKEP